MATRLLFRGLPVIVVIAAVVFWRTAYPTITWWDSSSYSLAAATLGITSSPGSLLLTLLGWVATRGATGVAVAHRLNLFAGVLAAITAGVVYVVALRVLRISGRDQVSDAIGAAVGALTFAFSVTLWQHAVMFTPYVLTATFTALILLVLVRWWEVADQPHAWRWLALAGLLFGLDFSVHRSNALLIPSAIVWVMIRHPRSMRQQHVVAASVGGLALGLCAQLLVMPIAAHTHSPINMFEPTTWRRFWDYVSLAQVGGGFLVKFYPRNSAFWSVQVGDFARAVRDNYLHRDSSLKMIGWLPACVALIGIVSLWRRDRRLGTAFAAALGLQACMTVLYFNIPANYFRSLDRHYLPVMVTIGVALSLGTATIARRLVTWRFERRRVAMVAAVLALAMLPVVQLVRNYRATDASQRYFTHDYATNALETLPPRALYFTVGDNDTFPLWYLQTVERVRPDVRVVNLSLANAGWYVNQLVRRDSSFPVSERYSSDRSVRPLDKPLDSLVVIDSITVRPRPMVGTQFLPSDMVMLDIVRTNAWRDPLCVSTTGSSSGLGWLAPYARLEGMHECIHPSPNVKTDPDLLRANLLEKQRYRGYADPSVVVDPVARTMGALLMNSLDGLLDADRARGDLVRCRDDARRMFAAVPPARLGLSPNDSAAIADRCHP